jgi:hypothetical protein
MAEMAGDLGVAEDAGDAEMRVGGGGVVDALPQRFGVEWGLRPAGEIGPGVNEREAGRKVDADEQVGPAIGVVQQLIEDRLP